MQLLLETAIIIFNINQRLSPEILTTTNNTGASPESNTDLLTLLTEINNKLDLQNKYLENNLEVHALNKQNNTSPNKPTITHPLDTKTLADHKTSLMNDMNQYNMTLPSFLSDPRLSTLPVQDKKDILDEMARRLDSGEIDKSKFLPGYKR